VNERRRHFVVTRKRGDAWDDGRTMREQDGWEAHAAFMDGLVDEGFMVLGGPLGDGQRTLLVVDAATEEEIESRLAEDPWSPAYLEIVSIEPWEILLRGAGLRPARRG
jgi:uncharacterized protein